MMIAAIKDGNIGRLLSSCSMYDAAFALVPTKTHYMKLHMSVSEAKVLLMSAMLDGVSGGWMTPCM